MPLWQFLILQGIRTFQKKRNSRQEFSSVKRQLKLRLLKLQNRQYSEKTCSINQVIKPNPTIDMERALHIFW